MSHITLTAAQAQPGDVVLDASGAVCQYDGDGQWERMSPVGSYGPPWSPAGVLVLLARDGAPAAPAEPPDH
jgi:hypothetical protein